MATEETALTGVQPADTPAAEGALAPVSTLGGDTGAAQAATAALDQATPAPELDQVLSAIPADDNDLQTYQGQQVYEPLVQTRKQVRVLSKAIKELQPLSVYQEFGDPAAVRDNLQLAKLLYSPLLRDGKPVYDPETKTPYVSTRPFVEHLDKVSPGMPEQLLVDLLNLSTENPSLLDTAGNPVREPLINQVFRYHKLDPRRLSEYQQIDAIIARTSGAITAEELAEIPADRHAAYRTIPPSIRSAWESYDPADQARMLDDYQRNLDAAVRDTERDKQDAARKAREAAEYQALVSTEQDKYLDTVRRERTASMIQSLARQVSFSTDPVTNRVMIGSLAASMSQLLDPAWRFVTIDEVLTPLGLKLDHTFDEALARFDSSAADSVALRLAGDIGRADQARNQANSAANQLMAKIAIFALKVAAKQGATVEEKATVLNGALATAATGRPGAGNGSGPATDIGALPPGVLPGSREATEFIARKVGLFRDSA